MKLFLIVLYSIFLSLFSIFSYTFIDPNLSYLKDLYSGFAFSYRLLTTIFYVTFVLISFIFYGIFVRLGVRKKIHAGEVFVLLSITFGILLFSYPAMLSYDIFNYIATSRVLFFYHENPYLVMPIEFIIDPLLSFTHAANKIALYGPIWVILTGVPYFLGFGNFVVNLFALKFLIGVFYLATAFLVWKISKSIMSLILFAFNPLVIIETLVSSHNDIVMIFLALLSFFLLMRKKILLGGLFLILSIFIKYTTVLLIPVFLFMIWKTIKKKEIHFEKIYYYSCILMYIAFLLSPIREEIYPWYVVWFLPFIFLVIDNKFLINVSIVFSFSLLLRYVPYIFTGTYAGNTPALKEIISFGFPVLYSLFYVFKKKV